MTQNLEAPRPTTAAGTTVLDRQVAPTVNVVLQQHGAVPAPARRSRRGVAAVALAAGGAALVGAGAFSAWDVTTSVDSGTLSAGSGSAATLLDANGSTFTTGVSNLLPADYFHRYIDVFNTGPLATFTGLVKASGDLAGQLSVVAETCPTAWTAAGCPGVPTPPRIGSGTPVSGTPVTVAHGPIAATTVQHVRYTFTFSGTAPDTMQGKSGQLAISVSNTVVGGNDRTLF